ncbi:MAG: Gfo/Idh/MocA family oxidoreductase [Candidatus Lindowbacteria bacterium]|nr:Gfo/Idh/MocA family oxidoreductase [Candidatus Lindowbacteria bacterium]
MKSGQKLRVGLVGYGYWGPNLARNFSSNADCELVRIAEKSQERFEVAKQAHPSVDVVTDSSQITSASDIDAVVIATPVHTHFALALEALDNGKHVWVEKPITSSHEEALKLVQKADDTGLVVMVDHTFLFTGAVKKMKEIIDSGELGDLHYYDSVRVNLGLFQSDINVIWDLAPHDLSIMDYLIDKDPISVTANGSDHYGRNLIDVGYVTVNYENNLIAHFHVNWLSPVKIRRTLVGGSKSSLVWDDLRADSNIMIYDRGVEIETKEGMYDLLASYRMGDMRSPMIGVREALAEEVSYFVDCIRRNEQPFNDAAAGARVVKILEAANRSLEGHGVPITL